MQTINRRQLAAIKRVAQNVHSLIQKRNKIAEKITALNKEYNDLIMEIEGHEMGVLNLTGYTSEALVMRITNADKTARYDIKPDALQYDNEHKVYNIIIGNDLNLIDKVDPSEIDTKEGELFPENILNVPQEVVDNLNALQEQEEQSQNQQDVFNTQS